MVFNERYKEPENPAEQADRNAKEARNILSNCNSNNLGPTNNRLNSIADKFQLKTGGVVTHNPKNNPKNNSDATLYRNPNTPIYNPKNNSDATLYRNPNAPIYNSKKSNLYPGANIYARVGYQSAHGKGASNTVGQIGGD